MNVGIIGCGQISGHYAGNAAAFDFDLVACADLDHDAAARLAREHGLERLDVDELLADPAVEVVLNLTPAAVHVEVSRACLAAGKHVYSEKPLASSEPDAAELTAEAERRGLLLGCAPDTFLSSGYQAARRLIDDGVIGEPIAATALALMSGPNEWHPNPEPFFAEGVGPLFEMGPYYVTAIVSLLGPVSRVTAFASTPTAERIVKTGSRAGSSFTVRAPTHVTAAMELASGATATLQASYESRSSYVPAVAIHGAEGTLILPDPNLFEGAVRIFRRPDDWDDVPYATRGPRDCRGIGLEDLTAAVSEGRQPRASGALAAHVVEIAASIVAAATEGRTVDIVSSADRPLPLPVEA